MHIKKKMLGTKKVQGWAFLRVQSDAETDKIQFEDEYNQLSITENWKMIYIYKHVSSGVQTATKEYILVNLLFC